MAWSWLCAVVCAVLLYTQGVGASNSSIATHGGGWLLLWSLPAPRQAITLSAADRRRRFNKGTHAALTSTHDVAQTMQVQPLPNNMYQHTTDCTHMHACLQVRLCWPDHAYTAVNKSTVVQVCLFVSLAASDDDCATIDMFEQGVVPRRKLNTMCTLPHLPSLTHTHMDGLAQLFKA